MKLFGGSGEHNGRSDRQTKKRPAAAQSGAKAQTAPKPQGKKGGRTAAPKKHSKKRIAAIVIAVLIALLCAAGAAYYVFFVRPPTDTIHDKTNGDKVDTSSLLNQGTRIKDVFTFVVGAVDEDQTRTDALMVATMNTKDKTINIMNVPRDTMCNNGESGAWRKINAAYATKKGIEQTKVEIERLMGFQPDRYVIVNFEGIAAIVDAIGGVDIDVQNDNELKELNRVIKDYGAERGKEFSGVEKTGLQTLDGVQALCYGRIRKGNTGDDWSRVERQSVVLNAMFARISSMDANGLLGIMNRLMPYVTTSLAPADVAPLIVGAIKNGVPAVEHVRFPLDGEWKYYGSNEYIMYDVDVVADELHEYIYNDVTPGTAAPSGSDGSTDSDDPADNTTGTSSPAAGSHKTETVDPESLVEDGGSYDASTGDYYDSDGDRYYLDENGNRVYY